MTSRSLRSSFSHSSIACSTSPPPPSSSSSTSSFTLFRCLPPELRLEIYRHACHPRVVSLTYHPVPEDAFFCPTHPPALLHVCRESRAEGLRMYVKCPLPSLHHPTDAAATEPDERRGEGDGDDDDGDDGRGRAAARRQARYFYFHPRHDTLYLPRPADPFGLGYGGWARELAAAVGGTFAGAVRRLAVDYVPAEVRRPWEAYGKLCLIGGCPRLEEAYLVVSSRAAAGDREEKEENNNNNNNNDDDDDDDDAEGEVELVDPGDGDGKIAEIMERVRESFRVEVGDAIAGLLRAPGRDGQRPGRGGEAGLELIPKAKVPSPSCAGRRLVCAS
ncbi:hypothetical protein VTH06DRAFT_370 [Thermothelomyces fergusii]